MLAKKQKLNSIQHKKVFNLGKRSHSSLFTLYALNVDPQENRYAVVVPKKVSRMAFKRNKNKRKTFDTIRNIYPHILPGYFFIIMARKDIDGLSKEDLEREVLNLFGSFLR